jgi:hypothetical protein
MSTGMSVKFKHVEIYNPQNFSRIAALNATNTALSFRSVNTTAVSYRCLVLTLILLM